MTALTDELYHQWQRSPPLSMRKATLYSFGESKPPLRCCLEAGQIKSALSETKTQTLQTVRSSLHPHQQSSPTRAGSRDRTITKRAAVSTQCAIGYTHQTVGREKRKSGSLPRTIPAESVPGDLLFGRARVRNCIRPRLPWGWVGFHRWDC